MSGEMRTVRYVGFGATVQPSQTAEGYNVTGTGHNRRNREGNQILTIAGGSPRELLVMVLSYSYISKSTYV